MYNKGRIIRFLPLFLFKYFVICVSESPIRSFSYLMGTCRLNSISSDMKVSVLAIPSIS